MHKPVRNILIVDDDRNFSLAVREALTSPEISVSMVYTARECLDFCLKNLVDVVLLDQRLPDAEGHDLCPSILGHNSQTKIIFSTAFPSFENAVKAVKNGAFDYLSKPFELEELKLAVKQALRTLELERVEQFQNYRSEREGVENLLVGDSGPISVIRRLIGLAANADAPVLITGETGSGKNMAARSIHYLGPLKHAPFISVNCAALPENLIEAELFGHEKGAFTGAAGLRKGMFELAEGGTLFLDEIGEMPVTLQSKLLGVLDDGTFRRLGGTTLMQAQVRVIAATSIDIEKSIKARKFREDLYYRLGVIKIHLPSLRERREDLPGLCAYLLEKVAKGRPVRLAAGELEMLANYNWPGNVRELKNVLERAVILQPGTELRPSEFIQHSHRNDITLIKDNKAQTSSGKSHTTLEETEKEHILSALAEHNGNCSRAARAIGISLSTLKRRLKKYQSG